MQQPTHINGAPVDDNTNTQTAGPRGPALLQDIGLLEKLAHFDREVDPRAAHARQGLGREYGCGVRDMLVRASADTG